MQIPSNKFIFQLLNVKSPNYNLGVWRNQWTFFPVSHFSMHCGWSLCYQVSTSCCRLQRRSSGLKRILSPRDQSLPHRGFQGKWFVGCPISQAGVVSYPEICKFDHLPLTALHSPRQNANPRGTQFISQCTCSEIKLDHFQELVFSIWVFHDMSQKIWKGWGVCISQRFALTGVAVHS